MSSDTFPRMIAVSYHSWAIVAAYKVATLHNLCPALSEPFDHSAE